MTTLEKLQRQLHIRKRNRERKRKLKQGHKAQREAIAVRKLRKRIERLASPRVMYDSVTIANIPSVAVAVAGYVGGLFHTLPGLREKFGKKARLVSIAVNSSQRAEILDIEVGDATIADAAEWFHTKAVRHAGRRPGFYISASDADSLVAVLAGAGIQRHEYRLWTAHWDGKHICGPETCNSVRSTRADATQWTTHGEQYDESKCRPSFWE